MHFVFGWDQLAELFEFFSNNESGPVLIFLLPAALLVLLGWLIKYRQVTWLISGYNTASKKEKERYDIDKLCKYMGNFIFILASILLMVAIGGIVFARYIDKIISVGFCVFVAVIVCGLVYLNTGKRVLKE